MDTPEVPVKELVVEPEKLALMFCKCGRVGYQNGETVWKLIDQPLLIFVRNLRHVQTVTMTQTKCLECR